jgi:hypothetical protein
VEPDNLIAGLRKWARLRDGHVRGAVELLIGHGYWLGREDFTSECIYRVSGGGAVLDWGKAQAHPWYASSSEVAVLDLAVALGSDRYRLSRASDGEAEAIIRAFATALGMEGMLR